MSLDLRGTGVALVTPFAKDKSVDYDGLGRLVDHVTKGGVDYLVVQGTTGESVTLTKAERQEVLKFVVEKNAGKLPLVFGHGGNNTAALIDGLADYNWDGVDAILSSSPYYNKPTQEGIYQHYKAFDAATPKPVILYNVPGRTASNMTAQTTIRIANDCENVIGIKEASGDLHQVCEILVERPRDKTFLVISGDDPLGLPHMALGGDGIISVIANVLPKEFSKLIHYMGIADINKARKIQGKLHYLYTLLFQEGNPAGAKVGLKLLDVCESYVRLPLVEASEKLTGEIDKILKTL